MALQTTSLSDLILNPNPIFQSRPYGMAVDSKDRIWFVETGRLFKRQGTAVESQVLPKVTLKYQTKQPGLSQ
jgi:hypothetical protein